MGKLARDVHEGKVVLKAIAVAVYSQRSHRWNSGAGSRQIVDILINNYYSDKDNLRSWTEDHVDAKCALSTLFYGRRRSTRLSTGYLERISFLFFLHRARRTTNEGIGGRNKMLKWMKEEYGERERERGNVRNRTKELCRTTKGKRRRWTTAKRESQLVRYSNGEPLVSYIKMTRRKKGER